MGPTWVYMDLNAPMVLTGRMGPYGYALDFRYFPGKTTETTWEPKYKKN